MEHIGKVIFDIPFMIQSHAESMKKIMEAKDLTKGQIILEVSSNSPKKQTNDFIVVVETNLFIRFWENSRIPKVLSKLSDL